MATSSSQPAPPAYEGKIIVSRMPYTRSQDEARFWLERGHYLYDIYGRLLEIVEWTERGHIPLTYARFNDPPYDPGNPNARETVVLEMRVKGLLARKACARAKDKLERYRRALELANGAPSARALMLRNSADRADHFARIAVDAFNRATGRVAAWRSPPQTAAHPAAIDRDDTLPDTWQIATDILREDIAEQPTFVQRMTQARPVYLFDYDQDGFPILRLAQ